MKVLNLTDKEFLVLYGVLSELERSLNLGETIDGFSYPNTDRFGLSFDGNELDDFRNVLEKCILNK